MIKADMDKETAADGRRWQTLCKKLWKLSKNIFRLFPISAKKLIHHVYQNVQPPEATVWRRTNIEIQYVDFVSLAQLESTPSMWLGIT